MKLKQFYREKAILKEFNITLSKIQEAANDVDSGSDEIAGAATDLASGTGEQASAVEELTATIMTVNSMAEESARQTNEAANNIVHGQSMAVFPEGDLTWVKDPNAIISEFRNGALKIAYKSKNCSGVPPHVRLFGLSSSSRSGSFQISQYSISILKPSAQPSV